jgi:transposase
MEVKHRRRFSKDFKMDVLNTLKIGDKSVTELAEELGIHKATIYNWVKQYDEDKEESFPGEGKLKPSDDELRKLRKQLADVTEERDILKKAISIFSKDPKKSTNT